jgi:hypothetical protein
VAYASLEAILPWRRESRRLVSVGDRGDWHRDGVIATLSHLSIFEKRAFEQS